MDSKIYGPEGRTYSVDIRSIMKKFPVSQLKEGKLISHEQLEEILGINRNSNRYKGIVFAWKNKMLNEYNRLLGSVRGEGYKLLDPHDRVSYSFRLQVSGIKKLEKCYNCAKTTDTSRLDEEDIRRRQRLMENSVSRLYAEEREKRKLEYIKDTLKEKDNNNKNGGKNEK